MATIKELIQGVENERLLESHSRRLTNVSIGEARRIERYYQAARNKVTQNLQFWQGSDTFTETRLRAVQAQIDSDLLELSRVIRGEVELSAEMAVEQSGNDTISEINRLEKKFRGAVLPIPEAAIDYSLDSDHYLFNNFVSSIENYSQRLRSRIYGELSTSVIARETHHQVIGRVERVMGANHWEAARVVRTEMSNIYNGSKILNFYKLRENNHVPDMMKGLYHPLDQRTGDDSKHLDALDLVVNLEDNFKYEWQGEIREFPAPPDRPNDRAILIPIRGDWMSPQ